MYYYYTDRGGRALIINLQPLQFDNPCDNPNCDYSCISINRAALFIGICRYCIFNCQCSFSHLDYLRHPLMLT